MKKILSAVLILTVLTSVISGCSGAKKDRIMYNVNVSKYITLGEYKDIKVDKDSDKLTEYKNNVLSSDISYNDLYIKKTEGTVADGDTVNIDYTGKKDGVAFEGGTATGSDLEIGSNSFIEGFESGLIGANIGDTIDLNLTFPDPYTSNPDLAGKAVVFTVKVNYVKTTEGMAPEDYYKDLDFDSIEDYNKDVEKRAVKNYLLDTVKDKSKIKDYPKADMDILYKSAKAMMEKNIKNQYGVDFTTYLQYINQTEEDFKTKIIDEQVKPLMDQQLVLYAVLDKEELEVTDSDISKKIEDSVKEYNNANITEETLKDYYGEFYFEYLTVSEKAIDFIYKNAKIS